MANYEYKVPKKGQLTLDDLPLAELSQWLTDNMLPDARTFLLPGSIGKASGGLGRLCSQYTGGTWSGTFGAGYIALTNLPITVKQPQAYIRCALNASCYTTVAGTVVNGYAKLVDGGELAYSGKFYFNQTNVHTQLSYELWLPATAGQHAVEMGINVQPGGYLQFDNNDGGWATVEETPTSP